MKVSKKYPAIVSFFIMSLLWQACKKEVSFQSAGDGANLDQRRSGVVPDNPDKIARVPTIMSHDFISNAETHLLSSDQLTSGKISGRRSKDGTPPTVSITSPADGSTVSGPVNLSANASDNVGVTLVSFALDGASIGNSSSAPYTVSWNSGSVANGTHTMTVTAFDAAGNNASAMVQITVSNVSSGDVTSPTVAITSPINSASVSGTLNVSINATDNVGVSNVKFIVDGNVQGTETTAPYSFLWDATSVAAGFHTLTATATDIAGNSSSNSIQVTVNTTILPPAPIPASFQLLTPTPGNQGNEGSCVAFAAAYAARSIEQYYTTNANVFSPDQNIFSPEYVYDQTKFGDCGSGTSITAVLDLIQSQGVCTWQFMPYSDVNGCSIQPDASQMANALNYKISSYAKIIDSDQVAIKTMISSNHPVITTIIADNSFVNAGPGFIWTTYSGSGSLPHTLIICGYDDAKHAYKVMNSWGISWGDAGFSWIDYDLFAEMSAYYTYVIQ